MTDDIKALVERLETNAKYLRKMMVNVSFGGDGLDITIKQPSVMLEDLDEAADALTRMQGVLAETVPDPEYRRMQDIEIERLREKSRVMKEETALLAGMYGDEIERLRGALRQIDSDERVPPWIREIALAALEAKP